MKIRSKIYTECSEWVQKCGSVLTVIGYAGNNNYLVQFDNSPIFTAQPKEIRAGNVKNKNKPSLFNIGFCGFGEYKVTIGSRPNGSSINSPAYEVWRGILRRCYDPAWKQYHTYGGSGVHVDKDWHNFQNFAKWYYTELDKMPKSLDTTFDVDKDLKGGKCYSEDNCILVPYKLNNFLQNMNYSSGMGYIKKCKKNPYNKITTTVSLLGKQVYIGLFSNQEEVDKSYNIAKNYVNRKVASEYKKLVLITEDTENLIIKKRNDYTLEDEDFLFRTHPTLKARIDGLFVKPENLLQRCKHKLSSEIY